MNISILEIAQIELNDAVEYYNYELPGLGDSFLIEALNTIQRICDFPEAWQYCSKRTKRCLMRRFPYGIIYQILDNEIIIIAVANLHRKPDYWNDRN